MPTPPSADPSAHRPLAGRTAIITGAGSGIGASAVALFVEAGAHVIAVDLPASPLPTGPGITPLAQDVSAADAPDAIVAAALGTGRLDIVFNNAGVASATPAAGTSDADWDRVVDINLRAVFRLSRAAIPHLIQSPAGRIINTSSVMAEGTDHGLSSYCASKAGVLGLTRSLAFELGKHGVTVNAVLPGAIRTGMTASLWDARPDVAEIWAKKAALRRLGQPEDIARVVLFLATDAAGFVTGQGLTVDGGLTLRV